MINSSLILDDRLRCTNINIASVGASPMRFHGLLNDAQMKRMFRVLNAIEKNPLEITKCAVTLGLCGGYSAEADRTVFYIHTSNKARINACNYNASSHTFRRGRNLGYLTF